MAKKLSKKPVTTNEATSVYFLKILLYFIIGSIWFKTISPVAGFDGFPVGLVIGLLFASHDHFQIDRKIEIAILLAAAILSYVAPVGVVLQLHNF